MRKWFLAAVLLAVLGLPALAGDPVSSFITDVAGSKKAEFYTPLVTAKAAKYGIPPLIVARVIYFESRFNPRCRAASGHTGLMQLSPGHAWRGENLYDPAQNIDLGCRLLAGYHSRLGGDWHRALSAYSHGPYQVASRGLRRTRYSRKILGN